MNQPAQRNGSDRCAPVSLAEFSVIGLSLWLLGGATIAGCGIGIDPSAVTEPDGAAVAGQDAETDPPDAEPSSTLPDGIPPIDQLTYENTEVATFALG
jgi:hypothetical protein